MKKPILLAAGLILAIAVVLLIAANTEFIKSKLGGANVTTDLNVDTISSKFDPLTQKNLNFSIDELTKNIIHLKGTGKSIPLNLKKSRVKQKRPNNSSKTTEHISGSRAFPKI